MVKQSDKICIICLLNGKGKIKLSDDDYFIIAVEKPYINLYSHKNCYKSVDLDELEQKLTENPKLWYN